MHTNQYGYEYTHTRHTYSRKHFSVRGRRSFESIRMHDPHIEYSNTLRTPATHMGVRESNLLGSYLKGLGKRRNLRKITRTSTFLGIQWVDALDVP